MATRTQWLSTVALALATTSACSSSADRQAKSGKAAGGTSTVVDPGTGSGPGVLTGRVVLLGNAIPVQTIQVTRDQELCAAAAGPFQKIDVDGEGGVAGAVIEVLGIEPPAEGWTWDAETPVLRQKDCKFTPFISVVPEGHTWTVVNEDRVAHNVNTGDWNEMQNVGGEPIVRPVKAPYGTRVSCNIHTWMEAWVYTVQSPHFTRSDAKGEFRIENIPPGTYRVHVWHPALQARPKRIKSTIGPGATVRETVEFQSPIS